MISSLKRIAEAVTGRMPTQGRRRLHESKPYELGPLGILKTTCTCMKITRWKERRNLARKMSKSFRKRQVFRSARRWEAARMTRLLHESVHCSAPSVATTSTKMNEAQGSWLNASKSRPTSPVPESRSPIAHHNPISIPASNPRRRKVQRGRRQTQQRWSWRGWLDRA